MNKLNQSNNSLTGKWPDPISFLGDYKDFAINARTLLVRMIVEKHSEAADDEEKKLWYMHRMEQFFFFWETLLAFHGASTTEGQIDLYMWLTTHFNDLNQNVRYHEREDLQQLYESEFPELDRNRLEEFVTCSVGITEYLQNTSQPTGDLIPIFNKLKHKFLIYRLNDEISVLLSEECERRLEEYGVSENAEKPWRQDMSWLADKIEAHKVLILNAIEIIIVRMHEHGNRWLSGPGQRAELISLTPEQYH